MKSEIMYYLTILWSSFSESLVCYMGAAYKMILRVLGKMNLGQNSWRILEQFCYYLPNSDQRSWTTPNWYHQRQLFQFYNQNFATVDIRILQKFKTEKQTTAAIVHIDKSMLPFFFPIDMNYFNFLLHYQISSLRRDINKNCK